jgi:ADP-heptose:LPS heptosyltransferase
MNAKIETIKKIDRFIGQVLAQAAVFFLPRCNALSSTASLRFLFIRPGGIGDAVLLLPAISAVKKTFPDSSIDILAEKRNAAVFLLCGSVNTVLQYDMPGDLVAAIRSSYDVVIDTEQWHRLSSVVARLTRAPMLIGYDTNNRKKLFTHPISYSHDDHENDSFLHLLGPLMERNDIEIKPPFLLISPEHSAHIRRYLLPLAGKRLISFFPGGSISQKRWGNDRFHDAIQLLVQRGYGIVLIGGEDDVSNAEEISGTLPSVINVCGKLSLVETAAIIKETDLLVSGDSGIMHMASALGTKVVALFGPSNATKWAPRSEQSIVISHPVECAPCSRYGYTPHCKRDVACMKQITVNEVVGAVLNLVER